MCCAAQSLPHTSQWPPNHGAGAHTHTRSHTHMAAHERGNTSKPKTAVNLMQLVTSLSLFLSRVRSLSPSLCLFLSLALSLSLSRSTARSLAPLFILCRSLSLYSLYSLFLSLSLSLSLSLYMNIYATPPERGHRRRDWAMEHGEVRYLGFTRLKASKWLNKLGQHNQREITVVRHFAMTWLTSARVEIVLLERQTRACSWALSTNPPLVSQRGLPPYGYIHVHV